MNVYYRNMAIIACSSIGVIMCWVIRWDHPLTDVELASKHRSTISTTTMLQTNENSGRTFNPNNSCASVLTCVEPSLRDV
jgi:hypothetical protein